MRHAAGSYRRTPLDPVCVHHSDINTQARNVLRLAEEVADDYRRGEPDPERLECLLAAGDAVAQSVRALCEAMGEAKVVRDWDRKDVG